MRTMKKMVPAKTQRNGCYRSLSTGNREQILGVWGFSRRSTTFPAEPCFQGFSKEYKTGYLSLGYSA